LKLFDDVYHMHRLYGDNLGHSWLEVI